MQTLKDTISAIAAQKASNYRLEPDELTNQACVDIFDATNFPPEAVEKHVRRTAERVRKREQRQARWSLVGDGADYRFVDPRPRDVDTVALSDLKERLRELPRDPFEAQVFQVILGEHPEFDTVAQFAANNKFCSRNHAYRRITKFRRLLQQSVRGSLLAEGF